MAATKTPKPRTYANPENLRRAARNAGIADIPYVVQAEGRKLIGVFKPRTPEERKRVIDARFSVE